jgi:predicted metal-dependent peptidase
MTALHMTAKDFKRLTKQIPLQGMNKSELMTLHLLIVEAVHGRLTQDELRSARFTESRDKFVNLFMGWKPGKKD